MNLYLSCTYIRKTFFFAFFLLLSFTSGRAQFLRTYNKYTNNFGRVVLALPDGGALLAGASTDSMGSPGASWDFFIRTDSLGDTLWTQQFYGSYFGPMGSSVDFSGNTYATGSESSMVISVYSPIIKIGPGGQLLWAKAINYLDLYSITASLDGGCIAAGFNADGLGNHSDVAILRMDSLGNILWNKYFPFAGDEYGYSVCQAGDSSIYVCGQFVTGSIRTTLVMKVHSNGSLAWCKSFSLPTGNSFGNWISATSGGFNLLATCWQNGHLVFMQCDTSGNVLRATDYACANSGRGASFCADGQGGYILTGSVFDPIPRLNVLLIHIDSLGHVLQSAIIRSAVINVQSNFDCVAKAAGIGFYTCFSSDSMGIGKSAVLCRFNDIGGLFCHNQSWPVSDTTFFVAVSTFSPADTQSLPLRNLILNNVSGAVISEPCGNPLGIGIPQNATNIAAAIFCNERCKLQIPFSGSAKGCIYDLSGRTLLELTELKEQCQFSTSDFVPGMYLLRIFNGQNEARYKLFVAH